jgi:hypothetical protein
MASASTESASASASDGFESNAVGTSIKRPSKTIRPKPKKVKPDSLSQVSGPTYGTETEPLCQNAGIQVYKGQAPETEPESTYCDPKLFVKRQIRRTVSLPFYKITKGIVIAQLLRNELAKMVEGRCSIEGYICPDTVAISSYSCGTLAAANIHFDIIADCLICYPDENSVITCVAKTITQAGVRAGAKDLERGKVSPIEVFLSRDMHASSRDLFSRIEENDILTVKIIGRRFVLHDTHITIIAMLLDVKKEYKV